MEKEARESIALLRYKIICPVLAEPGRVQNEYFRKTAAQKHNFPHYGLREISVSTMKLWLRAYRRHGLEGLKPKKRSDFGRPRRIKKDILTAIKVKCRAYPHWTVQKLHEEMKKECLLGDPPVHYNTLLKIIKTEQLLPKRGRKDIRKSFETEAVNDLWMCDFMHGPRVQLGKKEVKSILCAIIDDHSRMIVGYSFNTSETISSLTTVFKEALEAYGNPKRFFVDNGAAFSADLLVKSCALAGISLIHSRPYDSPSRGKIERFFRRVREQFLSGIILPLSLDEINQAFHHWLTEEYHHKVHTGINDKPINRYHVSAQKISIRRMSRIELNEVFLVRHERVVNNDSTISFKGVVYEVPTAYIRQKIEIRHPVDDQEELYLYDFDIRVGRIKKLDKKENSRTFRPDTVNTSLSFSKGRVQK